MTRIELEKVYDPRKVEQRWYTYWEANKLFHADVTSDKPSYTIMIPPPNVTGMLTMGHILNNTIQDLLIRWKKMEGYETLWMPGTDHAGIATQNKVEAALSEKKMNRHMLGREKFLQRVWEWKEKYGGIIFQQLRRLGAACDWQRECFTMDDNLSRAVREVFVRLYQKGLIYRGERLINWCPSCHTALSDEEVLYRDEEGKLWNIAYPYKDGEGEIIVATTRPETMLGDTAVAVNPEDKRYKNLVGKSVILPLMNREIPIIADAHADPEFGSGAVKITPAHDFNDFEVGQRHGLDMISVIGPDGKMNDNAGIYKGMDRFDARRQILMDLEKQGLLRGEINKTIPTPRCYRSRDIIEPYHSKQWFVKMKPLAQPAIEAVRSGRIKFYPKHWQETYFHWMTNIRDWCISRQIWWGHRVPVWYCENGHIIVSQDTPDRCDQCGQTNLRQDEDVLDTWFSSWLWPFSTLGWPDKTADLARFFPTSTLVTGPDIIFFWVARMIMASLEFMGDIPFREVNFNGMIRDLKGEKMSKSKGNSPDPLWLIDGATEAEMGDFPEKNPTYKGGVPAYGADAIRLTMVYLTPLGGDIRFDHKLVEMGQKFSNKLWNAARFVLMNLDAHETLLTPDKISDDQLELADRWILSRLNHTVADLTRSLQDYRLNDATHAVYDFIWGEYCDWYLELVKKRLYDEAQPEQRRIARSMIAYLLENIVRMLHPFMPFITEEIWHALPQEIQQEGPVRSIMLQRYPQVDKKRIDRAVESQMLLMQNLIGAVRNIRGEMNIPPMKEAEVILNTPDRELLAILQQYAGYVEKLGRISRIQYNQPRPGVAASAVVQGIEIFMPLDHLIDVDVEKMRLQKEIARIEEQLVALNNKLLNRDFITRAPKEVIEKEEKKKQDFSHALQKLQDSLRALTGKS
ncbi:valine--tRNA ligase [candidate division KSB1 bacterium]|nr:valine--tRNA ligase [candidate division KSB1 bacterium]